MSDINHALIRSNVAYSHALRKWISASKLNFSGVFCIYKLPKIADEMAEIVIFADEELMVGFVATERVRNG